MKILAPLRAFWPDLNQRRQLVLEYQRLTGMKTLLADIAKRGGVFTAGHVPAGDLFAAGIAEGRRQLALELIRTAGTDPATLQSVCTAPIPKPARDRHQED